MSGLSSADREMLKLVLDFAREHDGDEAWREVFVEWWEAYRPLSERQRAWLKGVADKLELQVEYLNEFSAGKVPRGEALATPVPDVLRKENLPKRPPGGRA